MTLSEKRYGLRLAVGVLAAVATGAVATTGPAVAAPSSGGDIRYADSAHAVAGSWIVALTDSAAGAAAGTARAAERVPAEAAGLTARYGGSVDRVFTAALTGFTARMSDAQARRLAADPAVAYVEQDQVVSATAVSSWGLDRVDQRALPLDGGYTAPNTAANVHAYIIDTGIRFSHGDFGGRASSGYDAVDGGSADDCNGHGTHVAGTVGGASYGLAKQVSLVAVRVLDCAGSGTTAGVIAGVDWVTANAVKPAVANMSLGGGRSTSLDNAVANSIGSGVTYAVAAGNSNARACNYSPARTPEAITVGATTDTDARASYSNYGTCVDIFAPGSSITSAWYGGDTASNTISGTSMASPHVAGAAALVLSANPGWTPQQVRDNLVATSTAGMVSGAGNGSPNQLLYVVH